MWTDFVLFLCRVFEIFLVGAGLWWGNIGLGNFKWAMDESNGPRQLVAISQIEHALAAVAFAFLLEVLCCIASTLVRIADKKQQGTLTPANPANPV